MAWSTRELAELAGTTIKTVRHYHRMHLLPLPERTANGYKQYRTTHLVQLLRVRRLTEVGLSLVQIREMTSSDLDPEVARTLDAELANEVTRLLRVRSELAVVLEHRLPLDTPPAFGAVAHKISDRDRALLAVLSQVLDADALDDIRDLMAESSDDDVASLAFVALPDDAADARIEEVAVGLTVSMRASMQRYPWMSDLRTVAPRGPRFAEAAVVPAVTELFSPAQLKVLARAHALLQEAPPHGP